MLDNNNKPATESSNHLDFSWARLHIVILVDRGRVLSVKTARGESHEARVARGSCQTGPTNPRRGAWSQS